MMIAHIKGDSPPYLEELKRDVLCGLSSPGRVLPCKWFYDERGSALFDQICQLPEYYPTRTELSIMEQYGHEMAVGLGPGITLVEFGSGSSLKTRRLLNRLIAPVAYVPLDISREHLLRSASQLQREFPQIPVIPACADYTAAFELPVGPEERLAAYFPGSTLGNFTQLEAGGFLARTAQLVRPGGALLLGLDLRKNLEELLLAYNDSQEVTAAFNLNLLARINRELGANFDLPSWHHIAIWNEAESRIEMRLVSDRKQVVQVCGQEFSFVEKEEILTEYSHKYSLESFANLATGSGWQVEEVWLDAHKRFSVQLLRSMG